MRALLLLLCSGIAYSQWIDLGVQVVASDASRSLNRLVLVCANPPQLLLYDPQTKSKSSVALGAAPISLSVSPDGQYAAVGHAASVSYLKLNPLSIEKTLPISGPAESVVLAGNGYIYAIPTASVSIATGAQTPLPPVNAIAPYYARLHPNGSSVLAGYSANAFRLDLTSASIPVFHPVSTESMYGWCGGIWFLGGGSRMLDGCQTVWQIPAGANSTAFSRVTSFANPQLFEGFRSAAQAANNLLILGKGKRVDLFDASNFARIGSIPLPLVSPFDSSGPEPTNILLLDNETRAVVLNTEWPRTSTQALLLDLPGSSRCSPTVAGSEVLPSTGGIVDINVTVAATCLWSAHTASSWISVAGPQVFLGSATLEVFAPPAGLPGAGTYRINIAGQNIDFTQAQATANSTYTLFPYDLVDSIYDKVNDRWFLLTRNPNRLWVWSTLGGGVVGIADLPERPVAFGMTKEGTFAAVAQQSEGSFSTRITHVDLLTMAITGTHTQSSLDALALFVGGGHIHVFGQNASRSYNVATQQWSAPVQGITYSGTALNPSGTAIYASGSVAGFRRFPIEQPLIARPDFGGSGSSCGGIWFSESGEDLLTACAQVWRLFGPTSALRWGRLPGVKETFTGAHSNARKSWLTNIAPTRIALHSDSTLSRVATLTYPSRLGEPAAQKLAVSPDGQRVYAVTRDAKAPGFEIRALDPTGTNGCTATLQATPASLPAVGGTMGVNIVVPTGCWWHLTSYPSWATPLQPPNSNETLAGPGSGGLAFTIAPNYTALPRSGTITIQGSDVSITQAAGTPPVGAPYPQTVSPSSGIVGATSFIARFSDPLGVANIGLVYLSIGNGPGTSHSCTVEYSRPSNSFRLLNDAASDFIPLSTSPTATWAGTNSQCGILARGLSGIATGDTLVITVPVVFTLAFDGPRRIFLLGNSTSGKTSLWRQRGAIEVADGEPEGVGVRQLLPVSGSGKVSGFKAIFTHGGGPSQQYLGYILFLKTPNIVWYTAKDSCLIEYNRISNGMRLVNDKGDNWIGPPEGTPVGTQNTLSNGVCSVNLAKVKAAVEATTMTVEAEVTFLSGTPAMATFLQAFDVTGKYTGMTQMGSWVPTVGGPIPGPAIDGVAQSALAGSDAVIAVTASHPSGVSNLSMVHLRVAPEIVTENACHVIYFVAENTLNLVTDNGMALVGSSNIPVGSPGTLSNSRCSVSTASASRSTTVNSVAVHVPVKLNPQMFDGYHRIYANAFDNFGNLTHWVNGGIFRVE